MSQHHSRPATRRGRVPISCLAGFVALLMIPAGCSKEEMQQALKDAKATGQSVTESAVSKVESTVSKVEAAVEDKLPESGSMTLDVTPSVEPCKKVDVNLITIGDGRPNVIQILSYDPSASSRSYPAVLLHGATTVSSVSGLAGASVDCDMYYQASAASPIAMTRAGESVKVTFGSMNVEDNAVSATLGAVELVDSADRPIPLRGGQITAVVREMEN